MWYCDPIAQEQTIVIVIWCLVDDGLEVDYLLLDIPGEYLLLPDIVGDWRLLLLLTIDVLVLAIIVYYYCYYVNCNFILFLLLNCVLYSIDYLLNIPFPHLFVAPHLLFPIWQVTTIVILTCDYSCVNWIVFPSDPLC